MKNTAFSLLLLAATAVACGSSSNDPSSSPAAPSPTSVASSAPPATAPTTAPTGTTAPPAPTPWVSPILPTRSAGCGNALPDAVGVNDATPAGRTFHIWGPTGYDANHAYPVVVMFHGWYTQGPDFEAWFQMEQYVDNEAIVVYPDAANQLWDLNGMTDVVFFDDMMKKLGDTYCIDPSRVLGFGFSYGGIFVNQLGCKRAGYVKAISIGEGGPGGDGQNCGRLPVLSTHRTVDQDEVIAGGRQANDNWAVFDGCSPDTDVSDPTMNCVSHRGCQAPGSVTFCEDTWTDADWPVDWNHTVREPYRQYTYDWFKALP